MAISAQPPSEQMYELHRFRAKGGTQTRTVVVEGHWKEFIAFRAWPILGQFFGLE